MHFYFLLLSCVHCSVCAYILYRKKCVPFVRMESSECLEFMQGTFVIYWYMQCVFTVDERSKNQCLRNVNMSLMFCFPFCRFDKSNFLSALTKIENGSQI